MLVGSDHCVHELWRDHVPAGDTLKLTMHSTVTLLRLQITIYTPSQSATTVTCRQCHKAAFGKDINRDSKVVTFIILNYNTRPLLSVSDKVLLSRHVNRQCCDSKYSVARYS